jgi:cysteine desulfurase
MSDTPLVYLDNNATTRVAPEVLEAMLPYFTERWGNPSSAYSFGHELTAAIDTAREQVAHLIGAEPREIFFTSCGTESSNAAHQSALITQPGKRHLVTAAVEHSATLKFCRHLEQQGVRVTYLPVNSNGGLDLDLLAQSIRPDTALVSLMLANNETGVLFPISQAAAIVRDKGVLVHTDAVQAVGKIPVKVDDLGVDFLSVSGHKFYAPKGIGALFVRHRCKFAPYLIGGGQERGRRGGTENVAGIVGFGQAAALALAALGETAARLAGLRDRLESGLLRAIDRSSRNGAEPRLPNTANLAFEGVEAEGILMLLDQAGICASSGSACTTGSLEPSHVLTAMGCSPARARASIRLSLGRYNTETEVDYALREIPSVIEKLRAYAPVA